MNYFDKALSDLVFASDMLKKESPGMHSIEDTQEIEKIIDDLESVIIDLENFLRNKGGY